MIFAVADESVNVTDACMGHRELRVERDRFLQKRQRLSRMKGLGLSQRQHVMAVSFEAVGPHLSDVVHLRRAGRAHISCKSQREQINLFEESLETAGGHALRRNELAVSHVIDVCINTDAFAGLY